MTQSRPTHNIPVPSRLVSSRLVSSDPKILQPRARSKQAERGEETSSSLYLWAWRCSVPIDLPSLSIVA
ncbi:uncharacterized protein LAJ45_08661 [Morchella importuna]|uniref:uncharacterized protein n=1 Tax=Morchella importuna TaxID=1174673 RepID=UPI001E8D571C|nr:uncharacterized protein LAJ45_08661 [Morchella importuna]KAH8147183.1 hypothetical protein LAJ45_08661 [Morchella importuna]